MTARTGYREVHLTYEEMRFLAKVLKYYDYQHRKKFSSLQMRRIRIRRLRQGLESTGFRGLEELKVERALLAHEEERYRKYEAINPIVARILARRFEGLANGRRPRSAQRTAEWLHATSP